MKKYLLGALCATAFLASCSNDDFMLDPVVTGGEGEKIDVVLGATYSDFVGDEADTRMVLVGKKWAWVNGDEIGSMKIVGSQPNSNDKFVLADSLDAPTQYATFKTEDGIYGGDYVFYHAFNRDKIKGDDIEVTFPTVQTVNPADELAHLTKQNMWISPKIIVDGIKYGAANKTAIQFVSLNAILKVNITNKSDHGALVVNKVEVVGSTDAFPVKANVDLTSGEGVSDPALNPKASTYADQLERAIEEMTKASNNIVGTVSSRTDKISAVLSGNGINLNANAEATVYILIPAGQYGIGAGATAPDDITDLKIYTNKGVFTVAAEDARKGDNKGHVANSVDFNRNSILNLYPALEGKAKTVAEYDVNNLDDWNNGVAYALANRNLIVEFNLKNNLEVSALPECPIYVGGDKKLTLKAGKEYALVGESFFNNLTNKGTLNLVDNIAIKNLTNSGTIKVAKTEDIKNTVPVTLTAPLTTYGVETLTNNGTIQLEGKMTTGTNWTNIYNEVVSPKVYGTINIVKGGNLVIGDATTNNGVINNAGTITLNGTLTNSVRASVPTDAKYYDNPLINIATASGTIKGDFARNTITNNGYIVLDGIKDVFLKKDGKVDVTTAIALASTGLVQAAIKPADVEDLPEIEEINAVSMTGAWDSDAIAKMNEGWGAIKVMAWDGVTLDVDEINNELNDVELLTIDGKSAINNSGNAATELDLAAGAEIVVNGDLTIGEDVTVGAEATTAVTMNVEGTVVNNGKVYAELTVGSQIRTGVFNTDAKFTNTKDAETHVVSAYAASAYTYDVLYLYGTFVNEGKAGKVHLSSIDYKVQGKSTFTGVWTVGR